MTTWWQRGEKVVYVERSARRDLTPEQMRAAFAVANDNLQWRAIHQAIQEEIDTCLRAAQDLTLNPAACACEVAAIEHLSRLGLKLSELRQSGIKAV